MYVHVCVCVYGSFWDKPQFCTLVCSSVTSSFTLLIFIDFIVMIYCTTLVYIVETVSSRIINYWFNYRDLNSQNRRKFKVHFVTSKTLFSKNVAHSQAYISCLSFYFVIKDSNMMHMYKPVFIVGFDYLVHFEGTWFSQTDVMDSVKSMIKVYTIIFYMFISSSHQMCVIMSL